MFRHILAGIAVAFLTVLVLAAIFAVTTGIPVPFHGWDRGIDVAIQSPIIVFVYMVGAPGPEVFGFQWSWLVSWLALLTIFTRNEVTTTKPNKAVNRSTHSRGNLNHCLPFCPVTADDYEVRG